MQEYNKHWANTLGCLSYTAGWNTVLSGAENCRMAVVSSQNFWQEQTIGSKLKSSCCEYGEMPIGSRLSLNESKQSNSVFTLP